MIFLGGHTNTIRAFKTLFLLICSAFSLQGCETKYFFSQANYFAKEKPDDPPVIDPPKQFTEEKRENNTSATVRTLRPVLAVRGANCMMCHANIQSNMITDFGYGDDYFMGGGQFVDYANSPQTHSWWFTNYLNTWQTSTIRGNLFVPKANVPNAAIISMRPLGGWPQDEIKLSQLLNTPYNTAVTDWLNRFGVPINSAFSHGIQPNEGEKVVSMDTIVIRAPSENEIFEGASQLNPNKVNFVEVRKPGSLKPPTTGFGVVNGKYVANTANVACFGDVAIHGPLYLHDLQLETDDEGCRLYVTGTVFIYGPITYVNESGKKNLQISSSRAIVMGLGYDDSLKDRLIDRPHNRRIRGGNWLDYAAAVRSDARDVGIDKIRDASDLASGGYPTAQSADNQTRFAVGYSRILLNAPTVDNRYLGNISGIVIAEIAMFSVGSFSFSFDSAFENVNILPLLSKDIIAVK